jgi:hypothetical protein
VAALVSPWSAAADVEFERERRHQQRPAFVAVIGSWSSVQDDGPTFNVDGERWSGQTPRSDLEAAGRSLFSTIGEPFLANGSAPEAFPLAVWRDVPAFSDGTIRVQFKLVAGRSDQTAGIVFGLQPSGEYLFLRYNTKDGNLAIWGFSGGARRVIARGTATAQLPLNGWHELVVTISGANVTGSVDGSALKGVAGQRLSGHGV